MQKIEQAELLALFTPSREDIQQATDALRLFADASLDGSAESMIPQLYVIARRVTTNGPDEVAACVFALACDFNTELQKKSALYRIGQLLRERHEVPMLVGLASECWQAVIQQGDQHRRFLIPEDDPERKEGVMLFVLYNGPAGGSCFHECRPVRRVDNKMFPAGEWESHAGQKMRSPLVEAVYRGFYGQVVNVQQPVGEDQSW